jgi:hypothetical protein
MDFSSWKKKCEDGKTCTLVHPKGHTMTIAMKALPAIQREQLKRLKFDEGGKVPVPPQQQSSDPDKQVRAKQMAQGAQQSGGMPDLTTMADRLKNAWEKGGKVQKYDDGTPDGTVEKDDSGTTHNGSPININIGVPGQSAQPAQPQISKGPATPPSPMNYQNQNISAPQENPTLGTEAQRTLESQNAGLTGIEQGRQADAAEAAAKAKYAQENVGAQQNLLKFQQAAINDIGTHTKELETNLKDINPNHYQENPGVGKKVATAIGLALGGFGTPFGGHNYAMDFLNNQINRDVAAQEKNNENKKTVWGAWNQLYNNKAAATQLALATTKDIYARQAELAALQQGDLRAQAAANAMKQKWGADSFQHRNNAAQILSEQGGGVQAPAQQQKQGPLYQSILAPSADDRIKNIQYELHAKGLDSDYGPLMQEYTQAKNADAGLQNINKSYQDLMNIVDEGGAGLRTALQGKNTITGLAEAVGGVFGHGAESAAATKGAMSGVSTDLMRRYGTAQSNLLTALSAATKGTNLGSGDLNELVMGNSPTYGDERKTRAEQLRTLRKTVVDHLNKGYLLKHGLSKLKD